MNAVLYILMTTAIADNLLFVRFEGLCPVLNEGKKDSTALYMCAANGLVSVFSVLLAWITGRFITGPLGLSYLNTVIMLFIVGSMVQAAENLTRRFFPVLGGELGIFPILLAVNGGITGLVLDVLSADQSLWTVLVRSIGISVGFAGSMLLFRGVYSRIEDSDIPEHYKGTPAALIAASMISLVFFGFAGALEGFFGM